MGELFGISQSQANEWIHTLLPVLKQALDDLGYEPERDPKKFKKRQMPSLTVPKGGVRDPKMRKNRLCTMVVRRKSIVRRMS